MGAKVLSSPDVGSGDVRRWLLASCRGRTEENMETISLLEAAKLERDGAERRLELAQQALEGTGSKMSG
jgi:hypothetical protein